MTQSLQQLAPPLNITNIELLRDIERASEQGNHDIVIDKTTSALSLSAAHVDRNRPTIRRLYQLRAMAYGNKRQFTEAFRDVNIIIEQVPHLPEGYLCASNLYLMQQQYDGSTGIVEAMKVINKGLELTQHPELQKMADTLLLRESTQLVERNQRRFDIMIHLPVEITDHIFAYLLDLLLLHNDDDNNMLLSSILNVSRQWRARVLGCSIIWTNINTKSFNNSNTINNRRLSRDISADLPPVPPNRNLYLFCNVMPMIGSFIKIMELHVNPDNKLYPTFVKHAKKGVFSNLQVLNIQSPRLDVWNLQRSNANSMLGVLQRIGPQLTDLKFNSDNNGNNILPCIFTVLSLCPNLKKLAIQTVRMISNQVSTSNTLSSIPQSTLHQLNSHCSTPASSNLNNTATATEPIPSTMRRPSATMMHLHHTGVRLERLCLRCDHIENNALERVLRHCMALQHLHVHGQLQNQEDVARMLEFYCPRLRLFNLNSPIGIDDNNDIDNDYPLQQPQEQEQQQINHNHPHYHEEQQQCFNGNVNESMMEDEDMDEFGLRHLYLSHDSVSIGTQLLLLTNYCNTLVTLDILIMTAFREQQEMMETMKQLSFPSLRKLSIEVQRNTGDTAANMIVRCPKLEEITVNIRQAELAHPTLTAISSEYLPHLQHLDIRSRTNMEDMSDRLAALLASYLPVHGGKLRKVCLTEFMVPNGSNVLTTLASLPLQSIELSSMIICKESMDAFVNTLKYNEQQVLEELCINSLPKDSVTDEMIQVLCSLPSLKTLKLLRVLKITNQCVDYFSTARLQLLVIQQCHLITQETIDQVKRTGIQHVEYVPMRSPAALRMR